ncbi:MAG: beta-propeller repeat protein [Acidimicrobiales bacterium]|jgi:YVTN family beta-propeller protein|nr:beta-propeller repeat protein [Acidimicrobiales bacterium]
MTIRRSIAVAIAVLLSGTGAFAAVKAMPRTNDATPQSPTGLYDNGALLPNGRLVQPAGHVTPLGDFPVAVAVAPKGDIAVVANSGQGEGSNPDQGNESLQVVDLGDGDVVQTITDHETGKPTFYSSGVAFSPSGAHAYVTGGGNDALYDYAVAGGRLTLAHTWITTAKHGLPQAPEAANVYGYSRGVAVSPKGDRVYVTNEQGGSVAALDAATGAPAWEAQLPGTGPSGAYPAAIALSPDGASAYVTAQGQNVVYAIDTATGAVRGAAAVGDHPSAIAVTRDGHTGFVANTNDDSVTVLDLTGPRPSAVHQLSVHLFPGEANGSSPDALAIDEQRKVVYVAAAGDDAVAVLGTDLSKAPGAWDGSALKVLGSIPTAWYPTGVAVGPRGSVLALSAKGYGGVPVVRRTQYDGNDMVGLLNRADAPTAASVVRGHAAALASLRFGAQTNAGRPADSPIPDAAHAGQSPIKHVVLVVRENRTFDQVFGDLGALGRPDADADPQYLEFGRTDSKGRTVTPNVHNLAARFGTSDNFYSDGEASVQGHHWTAEGIATDYVEKSWLHYYSNRAHPYDPTLPVSYPRCGAIFQQLALSGKTFRNFGELTGLTTTQAPAAPAPDGACTVPGGAGDAGSVASHDSVGNNLTLTSLKDTARLQEIKQVYGPMVATDRVPDFSYVVMGNDHTGGGVAGQPTPQAQVATNDLAVGGLVDYLSHTPQWSSTAVFVMEDDSQDGLDHRDGHRNILLVASPYTRAGVIGHLHISQASVLRTIELILGLQPLSSYTQTAPVPYELFASKPNLAAYTAEVPTYPIDATNPSPFYGTPASVPVNLSAIDVAGPLLEAQIWWATNPGRPMPAMLLRALAWRGGVSAAALDAWKAGRPCSCQPLLPGLRVAPGAGADADG